MSSFVAPYLCGNFDSSFFSFYDFIYSNLIVIPNDLVQKWNSYKWTTEVGLIYPFDNFCIISEKPTKINTKNGILHSEIGASVEYTDGFAIYSLNGVAVPKEIVTTKWDKLDSKLILTEKNAEIRREIVRKIGIEKICKDLKTEIIEKGTDQAGQPCELLNLNIDDTRKRPYIKLLNPSIGCYHIEGVPPECDTLEKALNSRKPIEMRKIPIDDINGKNWYQQGDVYVWPENAKSLKLNPKILT